MPLIDHDPDEPPKDTSKAPWLVLAIILAGIWGASLYLGDLHWKSVAIGAFTGMWLAAWSIDVTGNKVPASWRRDTTRR